MTQIDAFPTKKRGRPATGKAMTAAERKRAQRERDLNAIYDPENNIVNASTRGLAEELAKLVEAGDNYYLILSIVDQLEARAFLKAVRTGKHVKHRRHSSLIPFDSKKYLSDSHANGSRPEPTHPDA